MNNDNIKLLLENLSWNASQFDQSISVEALAKMEEINYSLLFDWERKDKWENTIKVVEKIGTPKNTFFIPDLLKLMQDINWPGAWQAVEVLAKMENKTLLPALCATIRDAYQEGDTLWLGGLKKVVERKEQLGYFLGDSEIINMLQEADF